MTDTDHFPHTLLAKWIVDTILELAPEITADDLRRFRLVLEADQKVEDLSRTYPKFFEHLNDDDIQRILASMEFHFGDTANQAEHALNQAVIDKIQALDPN